MSYWVRRDSGTVSFGVQEDSAVGKAPSQCVEARFLPYPHRRARLRKGRRGKPDVPSAGRASLGTNCGPTQARQIYASFQWVTVESSKKFLLFQFPAASIFALLFRTLHQERISLASVFINVNDRYRAKGLLRITGLAQRTLIRTRSWWRRRFRCWRIRWLRL
jgi:hypothetical protein